MRSSSSGKHKHKKEKKHKRHRSRSPRSTEYRSVGDDEEGIDLTGDNSHHRHKHKKHKQHHRERHHKQANEKESDQRSEVIAVPESDSDSSDCVEVPLDTNENRKSRSRDPVAPPPPQLSKYAEYEKERLKRKREHSRQRFDRDTKEYEDRNEREHSNKYDDYEEERERAKRYHDYHSDHRSEREVREYEYEQHEEKRSKRPRREYYSKQDRPEISEHNSTERESRSSERDHHSRYRNERSERERDGARGREPKEREYSPIPENGAGDCLSIEETNRLRAKLGLKPLEENSGPKPTTPETSDAKKRTGGKELNSYKDEWGEFFHKPADNLKEKAEAEKFREKLKQRKEKRFLETRLAHIRTLGESDEEVDDVSKWVQRNKRIADEKEEADRRAKALEEMDAEFGVDDLVEKERSEIRRKSYTDKHLKGLKVDHDVTSFSEGKTVILTLKDADVLDEKVGDTLVNVNMLDDERYQQNVENKKNNPLNYGYNVYDEQYDELGNPIERSILDKYDEDIDGKKLKTKTFVIGENLEEERERQRKLLKIKTKLAGKRLETLADAQITLASDILTESEMVRFKKPKKKIKKLRQKLKADDLAPLADGPLGRHLGNRIARRHSSDTEDNPMNKAANEAVDLKIEEDDDDLERILAKARKVKQKENIIKKSLPIDADLLKAEIKTETNNDDGQTSDEQGKDGHIVLNATAEFCRTLGDIPTYGMSGNREEASNDLMDFEVHEAVDERIGGATNEPESNHGTWNSVDPDEVMQPADLDNIVDEVEEVAILDEEPDVGAGVANALRLALSKGYLEKEEKNRPSNSKMAHLQAKNYSIEDKTTGDDEKFGRRDRFHTGPIVDFRDKDNFKPNIKLEYIDDNGRILNLKEAFRYLSHKFHGKGPGKNKIEKRLKKMEQEGLMKTMSSTDTPLGTLNMLQQKQKETKTAFVVLSGGKQTAAAAAAGTSISKFK
ncbi:U4/U6.U5 tri-snRNP-associated protein 1 [Glossina fuscipes]|uniref:U4/U6.U5 tri-snRNP-associated protein 1 n=1 Tax=Glossina fuscipes TaxID=7396 RepID=A0A8U0WA24_9MUSC|nr:U4/U6.U5 tri-snRNP-associated protein 1 [Glossina fuscipes]